MRADLEDTYLVYQGGEVFRSRLVHGISAAFDTAAEFVFGELPDPLEKESFDEFTVLKNDFENKSLWTETESLWQWECSSGFLVVVKVQNLLN